MHKTRKAARPCTLESLEERRLFSVFVSSGHLYVTPAVSGGTVTVVESAGTISVKGASTVTRNPVNFPASAVSMVNVTGTSGNDYITVDTTKVILVKAGGGDDYVVCGSQAPDGFNLVFGGDGADVIQGGTKQDYLYGDAGNDFLIAAGGNDELDAGSGDDVVFGGSGRDRIFGGAGSDKLYGEDGADIIHAEGDTGNDLVDGGAGIDVAYFNEPRTILTFDAFGRITGAISFSDTVTNCEDFHGS
jgi:Ca2+-binding RTX toxin-like protein